MRLKSHLFAVTLAVAIAGVGCSNLTSSPTTPTTTETGIAAITTGTYASVSSVTTTDPVCSNFSWQVTSTSTTSVSGRFTATCYGTLPISGTASAMLSGSDITWTATATGTAPGNVSCAVSLNGTLEINTSQIRIPYTGTTCLGPVSGAEIVRR